MVSVLKRFHCTLIVPLLALYLAYIWDCKAQVMNKKKNKQIKKNRANHYHWRGFQKSPVLHLKSEQTKSFVQIILTGHTPHGTRINPGTGSMGFVARYNFLRPSWEEVESETMVISARPSKMRVLRIVSMSFTVSVTWREGKSFQFLKRWRWLNYESPYSWKAFIFVFLYKFIATYRRYPV